MSAGDALRRMAVIAGAMTILLWVAIISPMVARRIMLGGHDESEASFLVCLLLPTSADWPVHIVAYALAGLLFVGFLAGMGSFFRQWYRTRRLMRALLKFRIASDSELTTGLLTPLGLQGRVDFIALDQPLAFCYGWLRPRICLATGALARLNQSEVEALLLHEHYHLLRRDPLKTSVSRLLAAAFFYLPIVRALYSQYLVAKEIEADGYVLASQQTRKPLLGALYKLLILQPQAHDTNGLAVAGVADSLNQRLDFLLSGRAPDGLRSTVLFTSAAVITAMSVITALVSWASVANALWEQAHSGLGGC